MSWLSSLGFKLGNLLQWTIFVLGLSLIVHGLIVFAAPTYLTQQTMNRILKDVGVNESQMTVTPSLDLLGSKHPPADRFVHACVFSLNRGPVMIVDHVPDEDWSLSVYSESRELIHRMTSETVGAGPFRAVLTGTGQPIETEEDIHLLPTDHFGGLVVLRSASPRQDPLDLPRCESLGRRKNQ